MAPELCPDCGQSKYMRIRRGPCNHCEGKHQGYYVRPTAKNCNGSNCDGGRKKSDGKKCCIDCLGTGRKLTRCEAPFCVNGFVEYSCKDEFHD